jgi:hypothetical protein
MTPQEQQLVDELFDRLAQVENSARDADAERVIANGVRRAPHATYALVQTALVMDEALKRANARIEELQAQVGDQPPPQQGRRLPRQHARRRARPPRPARFRSQCADPSHAAFVRRGRALSVIWSDCGPALGYWQG